MDKFYMAGTEGTGKYVVYAVTPAGRVGVRNLHDGRFRVRVEPVPGREGEIAAVLTAVAGWKQPDDQDRFSFVTSSEAYMRDAVQAALMAIGAAGLDTGPTTEWGPGAPDWAKEFAGAPTAEPEAEEEIDISSVEGADPAGLRAEAVLFDEQAAEDRAKAEELARKADEAYKRATTAEAQAEACRAKAQALEAAQAEFASAQARLRALGVAVPAAAVAISMAVVAKGLEGLTRGELLEVANDRGLSVATKATKAQIVAVILGGAVN